MARLQGEKGGCRVPPGVTTLYGIPSARHPTNLPMTHCPRYLPLEASAVAVAKGLGSGEGGIHGWGSKGIDGQLLVLGTRDSITWLT